MSEWNPDHKARYIAGLRELADWLEATEGLPTPYEGAYSALSLFVGDTREDLATISRSVPGRVDKGHGDNHFYLSWTFGNLMLQAHTGRGEVCRRVVVGHKEGVRRVPAPDAAMIEEKYTTEIVEWVCDEPLLAVDR